MEFLKLLKDPSPLISNYLALFIGPFLATDGVLQLVLGRGWMSTPPQEASPAPQISSFTLKITSVIEVLAGITLLYTTLRLLAAEVLLVMITFLEFNRTRGVKPLAWKLQIHTFVVTVGLLVIVVLDGAALFQKISLLNGATWEIKRWAGIEGREVGFDF